MKITLIQDLQCKISPPLTFNSKETFHEDAQIEESYIFGEGDCLYYSIKFSKNNKYIAGSTSVGRIDIFDLSTRELKF